MELRLKDITNLVSHIIRLEEDLDNKRGLKNALAAFKAVKKERHELDMKINNYKFYSMRNGKQFTSLQKKDSQEVAFKREEDDELFEVSLEGTGGLVDLVLNICAERELKKLINKNLLIIRDNEIYAVEDHSKGYLIVDVSTGESVEFKTPSELYELYSEAPHKEFEDHIVIKED